MRPVVGDWIDHSKWKDTGQSDANALTNDPMLTAANPLRESDTPDAPANNAAAVAANSDHGKIQPR
jgi:hypothetical protein